MNDLGLYLAFIGMFLCIIGIFTWPTFIVMGWISIIISLTILVFCVIND